MALPCVWGMLRAQRQRWWSTAALKQGLSGSPFDEHFDGHFFQSLATLGEALEPPSCFSSVEGHQRRGLHKCAVLEARVKGARKDFWNPLLTSEGQDIVEEELSKLRSWRESAGGNVSLQQLGQRGESKGGGRLGRAVADTETESGQTKVVVVQKPFKGPESRSKSADNDAPLQKTRAFGVHPPSSSRGIESEVAASCALPKQQKNVPVTLASQHRTEAQGKFQKGQLSNQAHTAALKSATRRQVIAHAKQNRGRQTESGRPKFGPQEAGEERFDAHFVVHQGTAVTGSQWLEVAPDAEESWGSFPSGSSIGVNQVGINLSRSMASEAGSEGKEIKISQALGGVQGVVGSGLEQLGSTVDVKEVAGESSAPGRSGVESNDTGSLGSISLLADSAETTCMHAESEQVPLDEEASSQGLPFSQQSSLEEQHLDMSVPDSSTQQVHVNSRSGEEGNGKDTSQADGQPELISNVSAENTASSESPSSGEPVEALQLSGENLAEGVEAADTAPDLEELRTWLMQLDRGGKEEEEEAAAAASVPMGQQKSLRLAIMGPPNAGKSVLTNALVGSKVSAVSAKTNTTRAAIIGVSTHRSTQLVICDTPGLASLAPGKFLRSTNKQLVNRAQRAGVDCDAVIVVIDAAREIERPDPRIPRMIAALSEHLPEDQKHVLVLNKADAVRRQDRPKLEALRERLQALHAFDRCFVTSGKRELGLKQLQRYLRNNAVLRRWELPEGRPTDLTDEQRAMDIVRQHLLDRLHKEVPYKIVVKPVSWEEKEDGLLEIRQDLVVDRKAIKAMVVGRGGATIKQITLGAREELGKILGRRIELFLSIRVEGT